MMDIGEDILRTVRAIRQHQIDCTGHQQETLRFQDPKEKVEQALWNLRKFEATGFRKYFDTATSILEGIIQ